MEKTRYQPRVTPETDHAIREYAEIMGMKPNAVVAQMLEQAAPGLVELTNAMRKLQGRPAQGLKDMAKTLEKRAQETQQMAMDLKPRPKRKKA